MRRTVAKKRCFERGMMEENRITQLGGEIGHWERQKKRTASFLGTAHRLDAVHGLVAVHRLVTVHRLVAVYHLDNVHRLETVHRLVAVHRLDTVHRLVTVDVLVLDKNTAFQKLEWSPSSEKSRGTH